MKARPPLVSALFLFAFTPSAVAGWLPDDPFSDKAAGQTAAAFLKNPVGARAEAMGETGVGVGGTVEALYWNPAGLVPLAKGDALHASFGYNKLLESASNGYLSGARAFGGGIVAVGVVYQTQDAIETFNVLGDSLGSIRPNDFALSAAYARSLSEGQIGGAFKVIRSDLGDASAMTVAVDAGLRVPGALSLNGAPVDFGMTLRNLGPGLKIGSESDPLPLAGALGFQWRLDRRFRLNLDGTVPVDQDPYVAVGAETRISAGSKLAAALRAGYNLKNTRDIDGFTGVTGGLGVRISKIQVDYAFVPFGDLGRTHRISFSTYF